MDVDERDWTEWNWRTEGDEMVNGAYFVPSGDGISNQYALASSMEPKSAFLIEQLTMNAGVIGVPRYPPPSIIEKSPRVSGTRLVYMIGL